MTDAPATSPLAARLAEAMAAAAEVTKSSRNTDQGYNYASAEVILAAVRKPLLERGIILIPQPRSIEEREVQFRRGTGTLATVTVDFTFIDGLTSERLVIEGWVGQGQDSGDKAVGKAYTSAIKTFIRAAWLLPTEDPTGEQQERVPSAGADPLGSRADEETRVAAVNALTKIVGEERVTDVGAHLAQQLDSMRVAAALTLITLAEELFPADATDERPAEAPDQPAEPEDVAGLLEDEDPRFDPPPLDNGAEF